MAIAILRTRLDLDHAHGRTHRFARLRGGIHEPDRPCALRRRQVGNCPPWQNGHAERLIGAIVVGRGAHHYGPFQAEGSPARAAHTGEQYLAPGACLLRLRP